MKAREIFSFLLLINNFVTIGLSFCSDVYQQSHYQTQSIYFSFYSDCLHHYLHTSISPISFEYSIRALGSLQCFEPVWSNG